MILHVTHYPAPQHEQRPVRTKRFPAIALTVAEKTGGLSELIYFYNCIVPAHIVASIVNVGVRGVLAQSTGAVTPTVTSRSTNC